MRNTTERSEAVKAGTVSLLCTNVDIFYETTICLLTDKKACEAMSNDVNPYGDGRASERIVQAVRYVYNKCSERPEEFK